MCQGAYSVLVFWSISFTASSYWSHLSRLRQSSSVIIKFWVQIDKDTQLERFNERQNTPQKQWKITDEDWRNREKWDQYEDAVNEMRPGIS